MAKQHHVRGEEISALKMYQLALPYFPNNEKLTNKMRSLEAKLRSRRKDTESVGPSPPTPPHATTQISVSQASRIEKPVSLASLALPPSSTSQNQRFRRKATEKLNDLEYQEEPGSGNDDEDDLDNDFPYKRVKPRKPPTTARAARLAVFRDPNTNPNLQHDTAYNLANGNVRSSSLDFDAHDPQTPRTRHLLHIINTRDLTQLKALRGVGTKKAESILESLNINNNSNNKKKSHSCFAADADGEENDVDVLGDDDDDDDAGCLRITSLKQLGGLKGVGSKTVENMRNGVVV
ncbi:MAG: hypothetical protein M1837_004918 [Sclerophora amabilis]|nr:MAG: hypothetical protein M1837_004918 [Sclerophora amabilis]